MLDQAGDELSQLLEKAFVQEVHLFSFKNIPEIHAAWFLLMLVKHISTNTQDQDKEPQRDCRQHEQGERRQPWRVGESRARDR